MSSDPTGLEREAQAAFEAAMAEFRRQTVEAPSAEGLLEAMVRAARQSFVTRLDQLREAARENARNLADKGYRPQRLRELGSDLSTSERKVMEARAQRLLTDLAKAHEQALGSGEASGTFSHDGLGSYPMPFEMIAAVAPRLFGDRFVDLMEEFLRDVASAGPAAAEYGATYQAWLMERERPSASLNALLPAAVAEFEQLLAALLRTGLRRHPEALGVDRKQFSVAEYHAAGGKAEVISQMAVDRIVGDYLRESIIKWNDNLTAWPGIALASLTSDWSGLVEVFLRRNVLVHSAGRVDIEYLRLLPSDLPRPWLGALLDADTDYLLRALARIELLGVALSVLWLPKILGRLAVTSATTANELVYRALRLEAWSDAVLLADQLLLVLNDEQRDSESGHTLRVNRWVGLLETTDDVAAISDEVATWVPPDDSVRWAIARAALSRDANGTAVLLRQAATSGIPLRQMNSWPLLERLAQKHPVVRQALTSKANPRSAAPRGRRK